MRRGAICLLVGAVLLANSGCSVLMGRPPVSPLDVRRYPDCGIPASAPAADLGAAVLGGLLMVAALQDEANAWGVALGTASVLLVASAVRGVKVHSDCDEARAAADPLFRRAPLRTLPVALPPAAPPPVETPSPEQPSPPATHAPPPPVKPPPFQ
jgi:hypothetical protein